MQSCLSKVCDIIAIMPQQGLESLLQSCLSKVCDMNQPKENEKQENTIHLQFYQYAAT
jgi:hypothetical protein